MPQRRRPGPETGSPRADRARPVRQEVAFLSRFQKALAARCRRRQSTDGRLPQNRSPGNSASKPEPDAAAVIPQSPRVRLFDGYSQPDLPESRGHHRRCEKRRDQSGRLHVCGPAIRPTAARTQKRRPTQCPRTEQLRSNAQNARRKRRRTGTSTRCLGERAEP